MLDYIEKHPIMHINLDQLLDAHFQKLGYADGFTLHNCLQHLGMRIFYKNAEYAKIAQGLLALKKLMES